MDETVPLEEMEGMVEMAQRVIEDLRGQSGLRDQKGPLEKTSLDQWERRDK